MFDTIGKDDIIMAFFPCVRFEDQAKLWFLGNNYSQKSWSDEQKLEYDLLFHEELHELYGLVTMMAIVCLRKGLRMIIENPYSVQHYLRNYWPIKPEIVDVDRRRNGDFYKKPTQYWFLNMQPKQELLFEAYPVQTKTYSVEHNPRIEGNSVKTSRSLISTDYANRFIRQFVLGEEKRVSYEQLTII